MIPTINIVATEQNINALRIKANMSVKDFKEKFHDYMDDKMGK